MIAYTIREFLPANELLNYFDAILRVLQPARAPRQQVQGRIKIIVKEMTPPVFTRQVEAEWERIRGGPGTVPDDEIERLADSSPTALSDFARDSVAYRARSPTAVPSPAGPTATSSRTSARATRSSRCR
jgi:sulfite reductase (NADPH) hemoprotein beta-component